jgi:stress response protein SCP2
MQKTLKIILILFYTSQAAAFTDNKFGQAIIIAAGGADSANSLYPYSNEYTQRMYGILKQRRLDDEDISYLKSDIQELDIKAAFKQAAQNLQTGQQFIFYLHGHARSKHFIISPNYELSASQFSELLNTIPQGVQQIIILDTCFSDSFVDEIANNKERIIITSADEKSLTWQIKYASFGDQLLRELQRGYSISEAFGFAEQIVKTQTHFFKNQAPALYNKPEKLVYLVSQGIYDFLPPTIEVHPRISIENKIAATLWLKATPTQETIQKVQAILIKPNFTIQDYQGLKTDFSRTEIELIYNPAQKRYEIVYDQFKQAGNWTIQYQAQGNNGLWSEIVTGEVKVINPNNKQTMMDISLNKSIYRAANNMQWNLTLSGKDIIVDLYLGMVLAEDNIKILIYPQNKFSEEVNNFKAYISDLKINGQKTYFIKSHLPEQIKKANYGACGVLIPPGETFKLEDQTNWIDVTCSEFAIE